MVSMTHVRTRFPQSVPVYITLQAQRKKMDSCVPVARYMARCDATRHDAMRRFDA